ncbi:hypothetical protein NK553_08560 [Pseudomonas sp. ZM23]|uniref:Uncharacterized protein n=1 Tax=Pseudomonas triclosanedens TaxID=2961893 RepID=A0ABY7A0S6_9PSED|nr:hypothetical protein [Pseudomonas triclosanedens]MCP8463994.1 hypothetical protein [Pseudomonas triclosanedens]MCP8469078.1 hypothetical protein [Pseudomonas triclosanedens]MCP8475800.1 hypothetical protein [Pseudomonas triclosanedens]WAI50495.1 hypothetical protein OU419_04290 [Pseudomonas triclosanedens]
MKRSTLLFIALGCHLLVNDLGLFLYKQLRGATDSRGYAPGAITRPALLPIVVANLCMAFASRRALKIGVAALACGSLAWLLLPYHPLRAAFYCGVLLALSLGAMMTATWLGRWQDRRRTA